MARYDRIARLDSPPREKAFPGWLALRDLEPDERNVDLGRRARLRFLAARLVHRLAAQGDDLDRDSLQQQCNAVREELGQLPGRDPERQRLAAFLKEVTSMDPRTTVAATLELAEVIGEGSSEFAAEELYRAAMELAATWGLEQLRAEAARRLLELGVALARSH